MKTFYSQNGEDFLLWSVFQSKKKPGIFIEVGALDGIRFSNTFYFEREGWTGVCVEPHPDYFLLLQKNRPGSFCVELAASNRIGKLDFYAASHGDFSTLLEENTRDEMLSRKMAGYKRIPVSISTLNLILEGAGMVPPIDIVSIDVEGAELDVLDGFNLSYYKPEVLIIEANDEFADMKLDAYMRQHNYHKSGRMGRSNNFYCRSWLTAVKLSLIPVRCTVSVQPLIGENKAVEFRELRLPSLKAQAWLRILKRILRRLKIK
ncbi:MAG: FkbM family methyltransferase [Anaerolineales bacterium]|nr:FkbM family methyltransferase [Anaerolineales bacterium]